VHEAAPVRTMQPLNNHLALCAGNQTVKRHQVPLTSSVGDQCSTLKLQMAMFGVAFFDWTFGNSQHSRFQHSEKKRVRLACVGNRTIPSVLELGRSVQKPQFSCSRQLLFSPLQHGIFALTVSFSCLCEIHLFV